MEIISMADSITVSTTQGLGFAKFFLHRHYCSSSSNNHLSLICDSAYESSSSIGVLSITSGISPVDAIAPPIVRPNLYRIVPRSPPRNKRRTRKRSLAGDSEDGEEDGFFGNGDDGTFGSGGGGGGSSGGKGWNFDRFGESNWEESSSSSASDPAFDFFYEVISWIALSNCIHFAYKKVVRIVADGIGAPSRQKAPMRLVTMC